MSMLEELALKGRGGLKKRVPSFTKKKSEAKMGGSIAELCLMKAKQRQRRSSALSKLLQKG